MGQNAGRSQINRTFRIEEYPNMTAEEEEELTCTEDTVKKPNRKHKAIFGTADLRNGAVGLYNIGLSCCLNSLLQVFFMNRHFTMILRLIQVPFEAVQQRASVPYQMLLLLEQMQRGRQKSVHPLNLARCLSMHNVKLFVLYDASQLFLILWNLIKNQITNVDLVESLTALYTIRLWEFVVCQDCLLEIKKESSLLMLPLPMLDLDSCPIRTLEDSLHSFFATEQLSADNACRCDRCERKTSCLLSTKVRALPQTLTLHLQRFCSKESGRTRKISHPLAFPSSLDLSQILTPEQFHADAWEKDDGLYDLFAVVAHSGLANFGHYCAYIRSFTDHRWYCFNDSSVCKVSWDDVKCTYGNAALRWGETAYLLVYMRKKN